MKFDIGDKVRFLNTTGGGKVVRIDGKLVYVEDEDGFDIPVLESEVVLIEKAQEQMKSVKVETVTTKPVVEEVVEEEDYDFNSEMADDKNPRFHVAFLKDGNGATPFLNLHIVNDSNYFAYFTLAQVTTSPNGRLLHFGTVEPNTKLLLGRYNPQAIDNQEWQIQLMLFKKVKEYGIYPPVSTAFKIKAARFFKENGFVNNDFFNEKAVLFPVIKGEFEKKLEQLTDMELMKVSAEKERVEKPRQAARRNEPELLEVDLHIHELIDDARGLSNGEILQLQLDKFKQVMQENINNKGRRIVFIHGVGSGTLKTELRKLLERSYKKHTFQDASFQEYGYGATMVIV
ncbi:MAG: DUF2027 domain-containing protein [Breznakibacter sp.]